MSQVPLNVRMENRIDVKAIYSFALGPYSRSPMEAWAALGEWVEKKKLQENIVEVVGFGMDNPLTTPPPLIRYVAAFGLSGGFQSDEDACVYEMTIPGGTYAVHTMVGPYHQMPDRFQRFQEEWLPTSNCQLDFCRPFLEIYTKKMGEVPEAELETELCLPVKEG